MTTTYTAKIQGLTLAGEMTLAEAIKASADHQVCIGLWSGDVHVWRVLHGRDADHFAPANLGLLTREEIIEWAEILVTYPWKLAGWRATAEFMRHASDIMTRSLVGLISGYIPDAAKPEVRRMALAIEEVRRWQEEGIASGDR